MLLECLDSTCLATLPTTHSQRLNSGNPLCTGRCEWLWSITTWANGTLSNASSRRRRANLFLRLKHFAARRLSSAFKNDRSLIKHNRGGYLNALVSATRKKGWERITIKILMGTSRKEDIREIAKVSRKKDEIRHTY